MAEYDRKLVLENGDEYLGRAFGGPAGGAVSELVFNTSMAGYQEIVYESDGGDDVSADRQLRDRRGRF